MTTPKPASILHFASIRGIFAMLLRTVGIDSPSRHQSPTISYRARQISTSGDPPTQVIVGQGNHSREAQMRAGDLDRKVRDLTSAPGHVCFSLRGDLHGCRSAVGPILRSIFVSVGVSQVCQPMPCVPTQRHQQMKGYGSCCPVLRSRSSLTDTSDTVLRGNPGNERNHRNSSRRSNPLVNALKHRVLSPKCRIHRHLQVTAVIEIPPSPPALYSRCL